MDCLGNVHHVQERELETLAPCQTLPKTSEESSGK